MKSAQPHALAPYAGMNKEDLLRYIDLFIVSFYTSRDMPQEGLQTVLSVVYKLSVSSLTK